MAELAEIPPREVLEKDTSQALEDAAAMRERMHPGGVPRGPNEDYALQMGALTAAMLAREFAGMPQLGRVAAAVMQALQAVLQASDEAGIDVGPHGLLVTGLLAGEQLDREARERHGGIGTADDISALWGVPAEGKCPTRAGSQARNGLVRSGIATVGDLLARTVADLEGLREFGPVAVAETLRALAGHGLALAGEEAPGGQ